MSSARYRANRGKARPSAVRPGAGPLLTSGQVAELTGFAVQTLANWRSAGTGPPYVKAGRIRYRRADVETWLDSLKIN